MSKDTLAPGPGLEENLVMPSSNPSAPTAEKTATSARARILFALAHDERDLFFPGELPAGAVWQEVRGLDRAGWHRMLADHRPEILVSGWSTPSLDSDFTTLDGRNGTIDYVCHAPGAIRHVVTREQLVAGLKVTNWGALVAPLVAEHALLLVLACLRQLSGWRGHLRPTTSGRRERLATRTLHGGRVAIHGFGVIARELIRLLQPFHPTITVYSAGVPADFIRKHGAIPMDSLPALAQDADIFVTCEALTEQSRNSINAAVLAGLAEGAVFVNVGRGAVVDEEALIQAARQRGLRLGCDVFVHEPLAADSPFFTLPEAILSPHIAGPTRDHYSACGRHALANIARYLAGETPVGLITPEIFDRST